MAEELRRVGAVVKEGADSLTIPGIWAEAEPPGDPVTVDPHGDHRIAMSLALTALRPPGVAISSPGVVGKSYPDFSQDLERPLRTAGERHRFSIDARSAPRDLPRRGIFVL